jgi:hypothetical protein
MLLTPGQNHHTFNLFLTIYYIAPVAVILRQHTGLELENTLRIDPTFSCSIAQAQLLQYGSFPIFNIVTYVCIVQPPYIKADGGFFLGEMLTA